LMYEPRQPFSYEIRKYSFELRNFSYISRISR
jgi:hypothetical protein